MAGAYKTNIKQNATRAVIQQPIGAAACINHPRKNIFTRIKKRRAEIET